MLLLPSAQFGANIRVSVNLATGAVATSGSPTATSATAVGNGWYRISVTASATATGSATIQVRLTNDANAGISAYTGDGYSGIYIWGAQLEAGAFPTSYIQTVASQVTRVADAASMTGANFSSWYNQAEGSLYAEAASTGYVPDTGFPLVMSIDDGTNNNRITAFQGSFLIGYSVTVRKNGVSASISDTTVDLSATPARLASGFSGSTLNVSVNGKSALSGTSAGMPVVNRLIIGGSGGVYLSALNGHIRKLSYYPIRCTDAQLQALTS
jgi:hypothetical protein